MTPAHVEIHGPKHVAIHGPKHVAIIMDGNGRWARRRGWERVRGHRAGAGVVRTITEEASRIGLTELTLYAFSSENFSRPEREVGILMRLLARYLIRERPTIMENSIRFTAIGRLDRLPDEVRREMDRTVAMSAGNTGMVLRLALAYGGRQEIADAARRIAMRVAAGEIRPADVDEAMVAAHLYDPAMRDPDLVIRTAGEYRVSNFLLWQVSYAEFWVTDTLWPDFTPGHLHAAIQAYQARERRFGGVGTAY